MVFYIMSDHKDVTMAQGRNIRPDGKKNLQVKLENRVDLFSGTAENLIFHKQIMYNRMHDWELYRLLKSRFGKLLMSDLRNYFSMRTQPLIKVQYKLQINSYTIKIQLDSSPSESFISDQDNTGQGVKNIESIAKFANDIDSANDKIYFVTMESEFSFLVLGDNDQSQSPSITYKKENLGRYNQPVYIFRTKEEMLNHIKKMYQISL